VAGAAVRLLPRTEALALWLARARDRIFKDRVIVSRRYSSQRSRIITGRSRPQLLFLPCITRKTSESLLGLASEACDSLASRVPAWVYAITRFFPLLAPFLPFLPFPPAPPSTACARRRGFRRVRMPRKMWKSAKRPWPSDVRRLPPLPVYTECLAGFFGKLPRKFKNFLRFGGCDITRAQKPRFFA
jgi:hypothetical protein